MKRTELELTPGSSLRDLRLQLGLSMRVVYKKSVQLARRLHSSSYQLPPSRMHEYECRGVVPSIFRLYTMAHIYGCSICTLMSLYGIPKR